MEALSMEDQLRLEPTTMSLIAEYTVIWQVNGHK